MLSAVTKTGTFNTADSDKCLSLQVGTKGSSVPSPAILLLQLFANQFYGEPKSVSTVEIKYLMMMIINFPLVYCHGAFLLAAAQRVALATRRGWGFSHTHSRYV